MSRLVDGRRIVAQPREIESLTKSQVIALIGQAMQSCINLDIETVAYNEERVLIYLTNGQIFVVRSNDLSEELTNLKNGDGTVNEVFLLRCLKDIADELPKGRPLRMMEGIIYSPLNLDTILCQLHEVETQLSHASDCPYRHGHGAECLCPRSDLLQLICDLEGE